MRRTILVVFGFAILEACSTSLVPTLPAHATGANASVPIAALARSASVATTSLPSAPVVAVTRDAVPASAPSSSIDLGALAQIVARLPHDLRRFEFDLYVCAGAVVAIGIVNACLMASVLVTRRRTAGAEHQRDDARAVASTAGSIPLAIVAPTPEPVTRTCACGAPIGVRSKTGRCRQCAIASRPKRAVREVGPARV